MKLKLVFAILIMVVVIVIVSFRQQPTGAVFGGPIILDPTYEMTAEVEASQPIQEIANATPGR
jgi:hypothetical protein